MTTSIHFLALLESLAAFGAIGAGMRMSSARPSAAALGVLEIVRDVRGVAHVYAASDEAAYFGAGYAAAQDRLFEMCWTRILHQGRAAEFLGPGPLDPSGIPRHLRHDRVSRAIGWKRHADLEAKALDPGTRALLEAYAAGVNAWIATALADGAELHPLFASLGVPLDPWTVPDCIGVWQRFARHYQPDGLDEAANLRLVESLRDQGLDDAAIVEHLTGDVVLDDDAAVVQQSDVPAAVQQAMHAYAEAHQLEPAAPIALELEPPHFSHAWAVGGERTTTGDAVLVGEPRIPISVPSLLYEWHMRGASFDVRGAGVPGSPNVLVGASADVAWSVTALGLDAADLFALDVAAGGATYTLDGAELPFEIDETETIHVRAPGTDETFRYRMSHFGPVVSEVVPQRLAGEDFALRMVPLVAPERSTHRAFARLYRTRTIEDFRAALAGWMNPAVNIVFASGDGRIGYTIAGGWPVRKPGAFLAGFLPQDGTQSAQDWIGTLPHELKPAVIDPAQGFVVSANHSPVGSWYPIPRPFGVVGDNDRSRRIKERLAPLFEATPDEVIDVRTDLVVPSRRDIVVLGLQLAKAQGHTFSGAARRALDFLEPWLASGARMDGVDPASALATFVPGTLRRGFGAPDALIEVYGSGQAGMSKYLKAKLAAIAADPPALLDDDDAIFLDGLLARAWRDTLAKAGGPGQWPAWYAANILHGSVPLWTTLEGFAPLERGTLAYGPIFGDGATLASPTAACYSLAVRVGVEDSALSRLPFGQAELASSPHFQDQQAAWQAEELLPAPTSRDAVEELGVESVTPLVYS